MIKQCVVCGADFKAHRTKKTCGAVCYNKNAINNKARPAQREKKREQNKRYRAKNREKLLKQGRQYYRANREKVNRAIRRGRTVNSLARQILRQLGIKIDPNTMEVTRDLR